MKKIFAQDISDALFYTLFSIIIGGLTLFWLSYTYPQAMNEDMGVLLIFAERFVNGGKFGVDIYEVNPPLSTLIYVPVIWFKNLTGLSLHFSSFFYVSVLLGLSTWLTNYVLKHDKSITNLDRLAIVAAYFLSNLFITVNDYGERDHFVLLGLMPLALSIFYETRGVRFNVAIEALIAAFGILMLLLKPHFGLVPAYLFIQRAWARRNLFAPCFDLTFMIMVFGCAVYIGCLLTVFHTFTFEQLPDIITLYVQKVFYPQYLYGLSLLLGLFIFISFTIHYTHDNRQRPDHLYYLTLILSLICTLGFLAQAKGLIYHLIPAISFLCINVTLLCYYDLSFYIKKKRALLIGVITPVLLCWLTIFYINLSFPSKDDIKDLPFAQWFKEYCPQDEQCKAYIFHETVDGIFGSFNYTNTIYASRFTAQWFLPEILSMQKQHEEGVEARLPKEEVDRLWKKFSQLVAEDLIKYKPHFIAIIESEYYLNSFDVNSKKFIFDYGTRYSENEAFRNEWKNYKYIGRKQVDRADYFKGTALDKEHIMTYDLYVRQ